MAEKNRIDGSTALENKEYRIITIEAAEKPKDIKLRVAAYARVSTSAADQQNSFAAQNRYYTTLITSKENWSLVDVYADSGITGTSAEKRGDFQRLLADCRRGKIDRVLTKSISRFARDTKDCLEAIRELKALGIGVCFEKENIDTSALSSEMVTTLFASFAQSESESISGNMRWSVQQRMKKGAFNTCRAPLGFQLVDGKLHIVADEASVVRKIFESYLKGMNSREIAQRLNEIQALGRVWRREAIDYVLKNERYYGSALLQKRYKTDTFPYQSKRNRGEREMYFVEDSNEAIVSPEVFQRAQIMRANRKHCENKVEKHKKSLSKIMICGCCNTIFRLKIIHQAPYWSCIKHDEKAAVCPCKPIAEKQIHAAFLRLYCKLKAHGKPILAQMASHLQTIRERRMLWSVDVIALNKQISSLISQNQTTAELKQHGLIDPDIFISRSNALAEQLRAAKLKKERLLDTAEDTAITQTRELMEVLDNGPDFLDAFDEELFSELIDKIIVESNDLLHFRLKNGLELTESIERTVR